MFSMKNFTVFVFSFFIFVSGFVFSQQTAINPTIMPYGIMIGDSCAGPGMESHDDGTFENGGGWAATVTDGRLVLKFTPTSYPWTYNKFCVALTRTSAGGTTLTFDVVVYDATGTGGEPGAQVALLPGQTATNIPIYPQYGWYNYNITVPPLTSGSYYIGLKYDASLAANANKFVMIDQSVPTPLWPGYGWANAGPWQTAQTLWTAYRSFGMRTQGTGGAPPVGCNLFKNAWCPIGQFPSMPAGTYFESAAWIGDTMYVQAPASDGTGATTIYRYTYNGSWSTGVPALVGVTGASLTACGGKLYLIGGGTTSITTGTNNVQEYNPATGMWTMKAPLPVPLSGHGSVCWGDSVVFVVGGPYSGAATNTNVYYYRINSNTWGTIANSLPAGQGRRTFAMGLVQGNKIVISAGFNTVYLNSTYVGTIGSNASQITWTQAPNAPVALSRPGGVGYGSYFYLIGGDTNGTAVKNTNTYVYSAISNSWFETIPNNPNPVSNMMNAITAKCINDTVRIFQAGGYNGTTGTPNLVVIGCGATITEVKGITNNIPEIFELKQNYPNPFNPSTKITFMLPRADNVKLVIYDMTGRLVATLVNEFKNAGSYTVDFNASDLASGAYIYRIESGTFTDSKKMLLIK